MNILLRSALIIDSSSPHHLQKRDILIQKGTITRIGKNISAEKNFKVVESKNLCVSPGWVDMAAFLGDPGLEHKEDLKSGSKAAAAGGFTTVCCLPNTKPALHSKSEVEYVLTKSESLPTTIRPIGALTIDCKGKDIAEIYDMNNSGAIAFSDGAATHVNAGMMLRSLLYVKPFNGLIYSFPDDASLSAGGQMNESVSSSKFGMKGIPNLAEELIVQRDIYLCEYTNSRVHFAFVSTPESLVHIKKAKTKGLNVSAAVAPFSLLLTDESLEQYDTNLKVYPPLRTAKDKEALIKGLKENTIDVITSHHTPHDTESKELEFDLADFGMIGLETAFAVANTALKNKLSLEEIVAKFAANPRSILNLPKATIAEGNSTDITFFDSEMKWKFDRKNIHSKSKNTPFVGMEFIGKPLGVINKNQVVMNE
jgi:dihydroorotase